MKKRYSLSLTQETVEDFQKTAKQLKLPNSVMSTLCDEAIAGTLKVFKQALASGKFTLTDLFTMIGQVTQQAIEEERKNETLARTERETHSEQEREKKKSGRKPDMSKVFRR